MSCPETAPCKRIVVTGAECTGKSTLTQALSGYYGEPWSAEFVRHYVDRLDRDLTREDLDPIARGQLAVEDAAGGKADRFALHDTNLLSSILYANHYFGEALDWVNETFLQRDYTLYLLSSPEGIPWQPDPGQRESPAARSELHEVFKSSLQQLSLPYIELHGNEAERASQAIHAIDAVIPPGTA